MPPAGGFGAVQYKRNLPFRGPSGVVVFAAVTAICTFGFYRVGLGNLEKRWDSMIKLSRIRSLSPYVSFSCASSFMLLILWRFNYFMSCDVHQEKEVCILVGDASPPGVLSIFCIWTYQSTIWTAKILELRTHYSGYDSGGNRLHSPICGI